MNDEQREELTELIKKLHSEQKLLAAICRGPSFFARAGVLKDALYTTTYSEDLVKELDIKDPFNRENFRDDFVVIDQHYITAKGNAFVDFAVEILDRFDPCDKPEQKVDTKNYFKGLLD